MTRARTAAALVSICAILIVVALPIAFDLLPKIIGRAPPAQDGLAPFNRTLTKGFSVRLYEDSRPPNGKIAPVQKGVVLVQNGAETIGEGGGFGAPVLHHDEKTYYSLDATAHRFRDGVAKNFSMDAVEAGENYNKTFEPVAPAGFVMVRYRYIADGLRIEVSLGGIPANSTLFILNEQSGTRYTRYRNSEGENLTVDFSWRQVNASANYLLDGDGRGFRIDRPAIPDGTELHLGRETRPEGFDWAGLDITIDTAIYGSPVYTYEVRIAG